MTISGNVDFNAKEVQQKIIDKMNVVIERSKNIIPYTTKDGRYNDESKEHIGWWTNGFWGGILWQLYQVTKKDIYKEQAEWVEKEMDRALFNHREMDHDSGFRWLPTSLAAYKFNQNKESYNRLRIAADNLAGRFNPVGNFIRAWNDDGDGLRAGWAIIDCMMNLPLLYWAYESTKDARYLHIATKHADTAQKYFIREDASANHIVEFDPVTGAYIKSQGGQGYAEGSSWTRGQTWALYGFTLSFLHTKNPAYLETAVRVADRFIERIPESGFIPVDFDQPADPAWEDSTAAAIAACGLIELAFILSGGSQGRSGAGSMAQNIASYVKSKGIADPEKAEKYKNATLFLLDKLCRERCDFSTEVDHIVERCTAAYHHKDHEFAIIYGDYYLIEAVWKLCGDDIFIW